LGVRRKRKNKRKKKMKTLTLTILLVVMMLLVGGTGFAIGSENDGCMKITLDPFSLLGGSEKEDEDRPEYVDDATDEEKYTYDAMGNKVPTRTGR
jgi:hypothetical protein